MEALNRWFQEQTSTPVGSILMFLLVFLFRLALDHETRKRAARKKPKTTKRAANGG